MKIHEYQAKQLFAKAGVPIPRGIVAKSPADAERAFGELGTKVCVVKSQIHAGGRGKGRFKEHPAAARRRAREVRRRTRRRMPHACSARRWSRFRPATRGSRSTRCTSSRGWTSPASCTSAIVVDREAGQPVMIASSEGGMEIEEVAARASRRRSSASTSIRRLGLQPYPGAQAGVRVWDSTRSALKSAEKFLPKVCQFFVDNDCSMAEINPLVVTEGRAAARARCQGDVRRQRPVPAQGLRRAARPQRRRADRSRARPTPG